MLITCERMWIGPGRIVRGWAIRVHGNRIVGVGPLKRLRSGHPPGEPILDLGLGCMLPGLVNAHAHLELGGLRDRVPARGGFVSWIRELQRLRGEEVSLEGEEAARDSMRRAIRLGAREMVHFGTTAVLDVSNSGLVPEILSTEPIRSVCALECIGLDPARAASVIERARRYLAVPDTARLRRTAVPHALYSCSAALLRALSSEEFHRGTPCLHFGESREETDLFDMGTGPLRTFIDEIFPDHDILVGEGPVERLERFYPPSPSLVAVHGYALRTPDLRRLSRSGATVVLCPGSRDHLRHPEPPLDEILKLRIPVALGTDSLASTASLSLWHEMSLLRRRHPGLSPGTILSWATAGGARALGLESGALAEGRLADWIAVEAEDIGDGDLEAFLVDEEPDVHAVGIDGELVLG